MTYYVKGKGSIRKKYAKLIGAFFVMFGIAFFAYFFLPVFSYQFFLSEAYEKSQIETPVPKYLVTKKSGSIGSLVSAGVSSLTTDYTDARKWYPSLSNSNAPQDVSKYTISIRRSFGENFSDTQV